MKLRSLPFYVRWLLGLAGLALLVLFTWLLDCPHGEPVPPALQRVTAIHEAAHAVVGLTVDPNFPLTRIEVATVLAKGQNTVGFNGHVKTKGPTTPEGRLKEATMLLAGDLAERILLGSEDYGYTEDQQKARAVCRPPCQHDLDDRCPLPTAEELNAIQEMTDVCLTTAELVAQKLVEDRGEDIIRLAELIMAQKPGFFDGRRRLDDLKVREFVLKACLKP